MSTLNDIASELADSTIVIMDRSGNDRLHFEVAAVLGAASQTLEEAYLTEVRVRMAGRAAKTFLKNKAIELVAAQKSAPK